jgi:hypothetical protein
MNLIKGEVKLDEVTNKEKHKFNCLLDKNDLKWNGFYNPYFDKENALKFMSILDLNDEEDKEIALDIMHILKKPYFFKGKNYYYFGGGFCWVHN